jgi:hypothetical protein
MNNPVSFAGVKLAVPLELQLEYQHLNFQRGLPAIQGPLEGRPGSNAIVVGGGPSLADTFDHESWSEVATFATNGTAKWMRARGFDPTHHVILDSRERVADYVDDVPLDSNTIHLIGSTVHPRVLDALEGRRVVLWAPFPNEDCAAIGGGHTVGLRTMSIATLLGYRRLHIHGFDCSAREGVGHAYGDRPDLKLKQFATEAGVKFWSTNSLAHQAMIFNKQCQILADWGVETILYGEGMLPTMMAEVPTEPFEFLSPDDIFAEPPEEWRAA